MVKQESAYHDLLEKATTQAQELRQEVTNPIPTLWPKYNPSPYWFNRP